MCKESGKFRGLLTARGIDDEFVFTSGGLPEGAFVAHRKATTLDRAVTSTSIDKAVFSRNDISRAIQNASIVVIDCSLSTQQIELIREYCDKYKKPIFASATSGSRGLKLLQLKKRNWKFIVILMSQRESEAILKIKLLPNKKTKYNSRKIILYCNELQTKYIVIYKNDKSIIIYENNGDIFCINLQITKNLSLLWVVEMLYLQLYALTIMTTVELILKQLRI